MGLQSVFKTAAQTIFTAFGDIPQSVTYTYVSGNPVYNPTTGASTGTTANYTISIIFDQYEAQDVDGVNIIVTDQIAMIPVENLAIVPSNNDYITISSERWNVVSKKTDPAKALWILQIRKP